MSTTPTHLHLDKVSEITLSATAYESTELILPKGTRWVTVHECSSDTARVFVLDTGVSSTSAAPAGRRRVQSYPSSYDVARWPAVHLCSNTGSVVVQVEPTKSYRARSKDCK